MAKKYKKQVQCKECGAFVFEGDSHTCPVATKRLAAGVAKGKEMRVCDACNGHPSGMCSRCGGTGDDPDLSNCQCDCCGGTGELQHRPCLDPVRRWTKATMRALVARGWATEEPGRTKMRDEFFRITATGKGTLATYDAPRVRRP
jgi:hypothetical protein